VKIENPTAPKIIGGIGKIEKKKEKENTTTSKSSGVGVKKMKLRREIEAEMASTIHQSA